MKQICFIATIIMGVAVAIFATLLGTILTMRAIDNAEVNYGPEEMTLVGCWAWVIIFGITAIAGIYLKIKDPARLDKEEQWTGRDYWVEFIYSIALSTGILIIYPGVYLFSVYQ